MYCIIEPEFYNFSVINEKLKGKIIHKLKQRNFSEKLNNKIDDVIDTLKNTEFDRERRNEFLKQTAIYDTKRNRDFRKTFPELKYI
jgi:flagellar hook-basal body complex protein FliE